MTESNTEIERIARRVPEDIATEGDLDAIDEVFAGNAVEHGPLGQERRGVEAIRDGIVGFRDAFPDFSATVEDVVAADDTVAMRVTLRGTHEGRFMGIDPTNESVEVGNVVFTRIEDGKIVERWVQPDTLGLFQQLGVVSPPWETSVA